MKIRVISGVAAAVLVIVVLVLHITFFFPLAIAATACVALYELYRAGRCLHCYVALSAGMLYGAVSPFLTFYEKDTFLSGFCIVCIMAMFFEMVFFHKRVQCTETLFVAAVTLLLVGSINTTILLLHDGKYGLGNVVLAFCSAWVVDTSAYFIGTFLGAHKLCPSISPHKTTEGFFGGILVNVLVAVLFSLIYSLVTDAEVQYTWLIIAAIVCGAVNTLGDLSASVLKRQQGIKDFGSIIPGHGGVMDRIDSALLTVPAFYVLICISPIFS